MPTAVRPSRSSAPKRLPSSGSGRARLAAADPNLDAQTAWRVARLTRHPDEHAYVLAHPDTYAHALAHLNDRRI
ncbi:hypothetical protein CG717_31680 [Streptomyces sp. CB02613]|nr:hypothetical protein CG717_31680 [Streptomyces sp. CB02613]